MVFLAIGVSWIFWGERFGNAVPWRRAGRSVESPKASDEKSIEVHAPRATVIGSGDSARLTWTVTGTTSPVRLMLHNKRPDIATLSGGNTMIVTTSGGAANRANVLVTGVSPGSVDIDVKIVSEPQRDVDHARELEAIFKTRLRRVADDLDAAAAKIPVIAGTTPDKGLVRTSDVFQVLDFAKDKLAEALPYQEFAPYRDCIAELVRRAKEEAVLRSAAARGSADGEILVVRNEGPMIPGTMEEGVFRMIVRSLADFFRSSSELSPVDTVCVVTSPDNGASLILYPPSLPSDRRGLRTASRVTLYLGRYAVEINDRKAGFVNVLLDPQRVVECSLRTAANAQACRPISGTLQRCP